jgi:hypothetical protein
MIPASSFDDDVAREKGRLLAAQAIAHNPDQKKKVEDLYGVDYCKRRFPEAYKSGFGRVLDRIFPFYLKRVEGK